MISSGYQEGAVKPLVSGEFHPHMSRNGRFCRPFDYNRDEI